MRTACCVLVSLIFCASGRAGDRTHLTRLQQYSGMADASAAVALTTNLFIVGNDEDNVLRVYRSDKPGPPVQVFDLNAFLQVYSKSPEADLEAAAKIGNRIYWMGSHGTNKEGKPRPNRGRFFATDFQVTGKRVSVEPVGLAYENLVEDFMAEPSLARFQLGRTARLPPKAEQGLNIEGLAATPERHLLIGFRNPVPDEKALVLPMLNPIEVIAGRHAKFGEPILLDLDDLGIRDMALCNDTYFIIAGGAQGGKRFHIFRWAGPGQSPEKIKTDSLGGYTPEALIFYPQSDCNSCQILSDDGKRYKTTVPWAQRRFRSFWLEL